MALPSEPPRPILSINSSAIPVAGLGAVGMLTVAVIMATAFPLTRAVTVLGALGGLLGAVALILHRRGRRPDVNTHRIS